MSIWLISVQIIDQIAAETKISGHAATSVLAASRVPARTLARPRSTGAVGSRIGLAASRIASPNNLPSQHPRRMYYRPVHNLCASAHRRSVCSTQAVEGVVNRQPFSSVAMKSASADSTLSHHGNAQLWRALIGAPPGLIHYVETIVKRFRGIEEPE